MHCFLKHSDMKNSGLFQPLQLLVQMTLGHEKAGTYFGISFITRLRKEQRTYHFICIGSSLFLRCSGNTSSAAESDRKVLESFQTQRNGDGHTYTKFTSTTLQMAATCYWFVKKDALNTQGMKSRINKVQRFHVMKTPVHSVNHNFQLVFAATVKLRSQRELTKNLFHHEHCVKRKSKKFNLILIDCVMRVL